MNTARSHLSHAWLSLYVIHTHADMRRCVYVPVAPFIFRPEAGYWVSLNVPVPLFLFPFFLFLSNHSSTSLSLTHTHIHTHTHTHSVSGARWWWWWCWCGFLLVLWREAVLLAGRKASLCPTVSAFPLFPLPAIIFPLQPSADNSAGWASAVVILHFATWEKKKKKTEWMREKKERQLQV